MKRVWFRASGVVLLSIAVGSAAVAQMGADVARKQTVTWDSPGQNENDSMPLGNGDLAANVWTEQNGDILLLLAKSDAWSEGGDLFKLGRVRLHLASTHFSRDGFHQTLNIADGSVVVGDRNNSVRIWVDANRPVLHTEFHLASADKLQVAVELWRKDGRDGATADTTFPARAGELSWVHWNASSIYPSLMTAEHMESLLPKYPDPLLHRAFGAAVVGPSMTATDDRHMESSRPAKDLRADIVALTRQNEASAEAWRGDMDGTVKDALATGVDAAWKAHEQWWSEFWDRSWIDVSGDADARSVTQGYAMQRYMMAASSRGVQPTKFNGGLFTVGHDLPAGQASSEKDHDPDYRRWGSNYWNQNNRLLYWPLIASGDFDLIKPWFQMYLDDLAFEKDRAQLYYGHEGAAYQETIFFFGVPRLQDFGVHNPTKALQSRWQRYHRQGSLEVLAQMLDVYDSTEDTEFARTAIVPFGDAIVTYYDLQWPRDNKGKILMSPAQSLETYQLNAINPTPDIAGLKAALPRLLALAGGLVTESQRARWSKVLADLPPIPEGKSTLTGKTPPFGVGDAAGKTVILPAEQYGKTANGENPELYVAFPYRLYGLGKPDLELARDTFAARRFPQDTCWGQDGTQASVLGLTDVARKAVVAEFTNYGDQRFQWFWKAAHDWIPDLDNGGSGMITLQNMLLQVDGRRIQVMPAWPREWTADFRLHAPYKTTITGHVEDGRLTRLEVTPKERRGDVVVVGARDAVGDSGF